MPKGVYDHSKIKAKHKDNCGCCICIPWNKGKTFSKTHRENISKAKKGKQLGHPNRNFGPAYNKGKTYEEVFGKEQADKIRKKLSESHKGQITWNTGKKLPEISGKNHPRYIDGRSKSLSPGRYVDDWDAIRLVVYRRDKFTCQDCGSLMKGSKEAFHVHHKIPFLVSKDNSLDNLITLCKGCHEHPGCPKKNKKS